MIFLLQNFAAKWGKKNIPQNLKCIFSSLSIFVKCEIGLLQACLTL